MNARTLLPPVLSAMAGIVALIAAVVLEITLFGALLPGGPNGEAIGWDPVSLWHQSVTSKMFVVGAMGATVGIPLLAFVVVFLYGYRRLSSPPGVSD